MGLSLKNLSCVALAAAVVGLSTGCATTSIYAPAALDEVPFRDRAVSETKGNLAVTVAVPSPQESRDLFGFKIDPDVDETRAYLAMDLMYGQGVARFGYLKGLGAAPLDAPRGNLTGDPYITDGLRMVLFMSAKPVSLDEVEYLRWEKSKRH